MTFYDKASNFMTLSFMTSGSSAYILLAVLNIINNKPSTCDLDSGKLRFRVGVRKKVPKFRSHINQYVHKIWGGGAKSVKQNGPRFTFDGIETKFYQQFSTESQILSTTETSSRRSNNFGNNLRWKHTLSSRLSCVIRPLERQKLIHCGRLLGPRTWSGNQCFHYTSSDFLEKKWSVFLNVMLFELPNNSKYPKIVYFLPRTMSKIKFFFI